MSDLLKLIAGLPAEKRALLAELLRPAPEPIAIIGLGCRFPGGANSPQAYWQNLLNGVDTIGPVPPDRWDGDAYYDDDQNRPGRMNTRLGGFIDQPIDKFDTYFFGISPREAVYADPQHRVLLEVVWEALEHAGQVMDNLAGSLTGVFLGLCTADYTWLQYGDPNDISTYTAAGIAHSIAANRISYQFDFQGPSMAFDTACSSSLVALHVACASLRNKECNMALAGGINLMISPLMTMALAKVLTMAADGRCKTFDARADGITRGEGCGIVVLKRLSDAIKDGDNVLAVVRGTAVNQDGRTAGLTAPNGLSQQAVIRQALKNANLEPTQINYVEAHGTGTPLGDPIEVEALANVYGPPRADGQPCVLGSAKTNLGHLEAAAGIAGLIKVVLAMQHKTIPPHLHFRELNPSISLTNTRFQISTAPRPWPQLNEPNRAGVSSFGMGGTNAHVILEETPAQAARPLTAASERPQILVISARNDDARHTLAQAYQQFLTSAPETSLTDICYTATRRRTQHNSRLAIIGNSQAELSERLEAFLNGENRAGLVAGNKTLGRQNRIVFVCSGQGPQWWGMGRELLAKEPVFRATVEKCDALLQPLTNWSLLAELAKDEAESRLGETEVAQPALFALQIALAELWQSWDISANAVVGHSLGEVAAAHLAGVLSLADAIKVVYHRSRLMQRVTGQGKMAVVSLRLEEAQAAIAGYEDIISVGAHNSPQQTVLSGDPERLQQIINDLTARQVSCRLMPVNYAFHSPQMESLKAELVTALRGISTQPAKLPVFSTVTGKLATDSDFNAAYWAQNVRERVRFADAIENLIKEEYNIYLELGPHPVLSAPLNECLRVRKFAGVVLASLRRKEDERTVMMESLGALYTIGYPIEWQHFYATGRVVADLPTYPWQRERFWVENRYANSHQRPQKYYQFDGSGAADPLLGHYVRPATDNGTHLWETAISTERLPYLKDHLIMGKVMLPATSYLTMAAAAMKEAFGAQYQLSDINFAKALWLPEDGAKTLQLIAQTTAGKITFQFYSLDEATANSAEPRWQLHASGSFSPAASAQAPEHAHPEQIRARCQQIIVQSEHYLIMAERGASYGESFQAVKQIWRQDAEALGEMILPDKIAKEANEYDIHPALLDACFQVLGATLPELEESYHVPVGLQSLHIYGDLSRVRWSHAILRTSGAAGAHSHDKFEGDIFLLDDAGQVMLEVRGFNVQRIEREKAAGARGNSLDDLFYRVEWQLKTRPHHSAQNSASGAHSLAETGNWLIFLDSRGVGQKLKTMLEARGEDVFTVALGNAYRKIKPGHYELDPASANDFQLLLKDAFASRQLTCRGIIHLWSLETAPPQKTTLETVAEANRLTCASVLHLVQALPQAAWRNAPRLWLVTRGVQPIGEFGALSIAQAPIWGLGKTLTHEYAELRCTRVDLHARHGMEEVEALFEEFWADDIEDQLALHRKDRYVARLLHFQPENQELAIRSDASYLITGGCGSLGLLTAEWLVTKGARHLLLIGRRSPDEQAAARIEKLSAAGAQVLTVQADIANEGELKAALDRLRAEMPALRGVIHTAGTLDDGILMQLDYGRFERVMAAKVAGSWNLHTLTLDDELDLFVCFSSAAALLGSPGQGNYSAANAFMDTLSSHRQGQGLKGLSINWGPWQDAGMAAAAANRGERMAARGVGSLKSDEGMAAFGRLIGQRIAQAGALSLDVRQWRQSFIKAAGSPFLLELADSEQKQQRAESQIRTEMTALASGSERRAYLESYLQKEVAQEFRLAPARINIHTPLSEMGLDSLMAVELRNRLEASLQLTLPATLAWTYPTIVSLASYLAQEMGITLEDEDAAAAPVAEKVDEQQDKLLAELEELSESEAEQLLLEKLAVIGKDLNKRKI